MEIVEVLKIQNRYLETQLQTDSIKCLKKFNDELIEKIEFKQNNPILFSEEITRMFVKHGFCYRGQTMGKSWSSYHCWDLKCYFRYNNDKLEWDNESILFCYGVGKYVLIENKKCLSEEYFNDLIKIAFNELVEIPKKDLA